MKSYADQTGLELPGTALIEVAAAHSQDERVLVLAPLSLARLDLNQQVRGVLDRLAKEIHSRNALVQVKPHLPEVQADPLVLDQILTRLLDNALTFVAPGVAPIIHIRAECRGPALVRLFIEDNGLGVEAEHHERIFRVFERLHSNDVRTGTGIGLAIVRKGAEHMGGAAGVESQSGTGSKFWLDLPAAVNNE